MGKIKNFFTKNRAVTVTNYQMVTDESNGFFGWNGNLYHSDIVRAAIRPKARAIGKTVAKHIRKGVNGTDINPNVFMRFLLEEPNPLMTMQMLLEKTITQLELNNNAFIYIDRDENDMPKQLIPITPYGVEIIKDTINRLYYKFQLGNGRTVIFNHADVIHLRKDFNANEFFGEGNGQALTSTMEVVNTTDQGIIKAIKNSNIIKWLLKFNQTLRPEDLRKQTKQFVNDFLSSESESVGAAATDSKMEATQVQPTDYVPNEKQMERATERIYSFFNTNEKIIQSKYSENEWIAYYESVVEPDIIQLSQEFTRKLFTRNERSYGNSIIFESSNLSFASMQTKLNLVQFVDRGILNPNEVREILNYAPTPEGDQYIRRLDTRPTTE